MIAMHMFAFVDKGISLIQGAQVQFVCSGLTHFSGEGGVISQVSDTTELCSTPCSRHIFRLAFLIKRIIAVYS